MEEALSKIRPHTSSSQVHQKTPATLLVALESTFADQKTENSPTAYFASLLTTLEGTLQKKDFGLSDADVLPAELYLLALVAPFVPQAVIRTHLNTLLSLTAPLFPALLDFAPPLRSQLSLYHVVLRALDRAQLEVQGIRQAFASILQLCLDQRPKVRRKAAEVIKDVISLPPTPLSTHPYSERVADWIKAALAEANTGVMPRSKTTGKPVEAPATDAAIHVLAFLRPVLFHLPSQSLPVITNQLLTLPRLGNPYLSQSAYSILSDLFSAPPADEEANVTAQIPGVLKAVLSSPPSKSATTLSPAWVSVLGSAMVAYSEADPTACAGEVARVWKVVWNFLESVDAPTRKAAAESLGLLAKCFTPKLINEAIADKAPEPTSTLGKIISQTTKAIDSVAFARSIPELLTVISSLIISLQYRPDPSGSSKPGPRSAPTAAELLLTPQIQYIGKLRTAKTFDYKEGADAVLATAMRVLGPEVLLKILPLNLEPSDRKSGLEPRAYLLPLLSQPHSSPLGHFVEYFVPLTERMFDLEAKAEGESRPSEAKVWNVLIAQIWAGLSGYCYAPPDLKQAMTPEFARLLSSLLYAQSDMRPSVLRALKILVDSNVAIASPPSDAEVKDKKAVVGRLEPISAQAAEGNLAYLRSTIENWLAIFFNVFGSVGKSDRGMIGGVIASWAAIAGDEEIDKAYHKLVYMFQWNLERISKAQDPTAPDSHASTTTAVQDIFVLTMPYLLPTAKLALFELMMAPGVLGFKDNGIQKRAYKILCRLIETTEDLKLDAEDVLKRLNELADQLAPAAKKDRNNLLTLLIPHLPSTAMHVIPSLIPEAVLGTKEPSEKARSAAFEVIVAMGKKMSEGGIVKRNLIEGMDEDADMEHGNTAAEATASVEEYLTMVAGGLAGASPHMISATVTAISRLVFEFKDTISLHMQNEVFTTLLVFLSSANREIVKSILGFIKLAIHTLPADLLRPHLKELVPALLAWSHDHKNHFKSKVRHIFERMLRRFGWDEVYSCAGEEEAAKVLVNIRKRKERAKRKKNARAEEDDDEDVPAAPKPTAGDAFEDVLYGSESELDDSDDERPASSARTAAPKKKQGAEHGARLRIDDDEPMDLLQGVASRVATSKTDKRRKPGQDASKFKTDEDTGKMIIDAEDDGNNSDIEAAVEDVSGTAYREGLTSIDGFTRRPDGTVKFNKDTKKRRREIAELDGDVEMADGEAADKPKTKKRVEAKFGHEFKAKRAGGDVKKNGVDPYAYVSLSQAAKRGGGKGGKAKIGIAGKQ